MTGAAGSSFRERAEVQLANARMRANVAVAVDQRERGRRAIFDGLDHAGLVGAAQAIRDHTLARLDRYLGEFARNAEARGTKVFFAADAAEAVGYVRDLLAARGVRLVAKSKSMVTEEIELNRGLAEFGAEVVETDLGEYLVQLAGEAPSHITAPAVHMSRGEIAALLSRRHGRRLPEDPEALTGFVRGVLRETFLAAGVGISGVNFAVAETGSFVTVTNEGNGRMVTSLPPVHVAIMGMERIVPSFRDLGLMLPMLVASSVGRPVTAYLSFVNGPRRPGEVDGPEEVHVVVLDNGRSAILRSAYRSVLRCIRCGACQNVCPVYRQVGGHGYGSVYAGPIGAVVTPLLQGRDRAGDLPFASSLCGACDEVCPVGIPLSGHLLGLRADAVRGKGLADPETAAWRAWAAAWRRPETYRLTGLVARLGQLPLARGGRISRAPFPLSRWTGGRDLPAAAGETFRARWERRLRRG